MHCRTTFAATRHVSWALNTHKCVCGRGLTANAYLAFLEPTNTFWMKFLSQFVTDVLKMFCSNTVVRKFELNTRYSFWNDMKVYYIDQLVRGWLALCCIINLIWFDLIIITCSACRLGAGLYTGKSSFLLLFSMTLLFLCTELSLFSLCYSYTVPLMFSSVQLFL